MKSIKEQPATDENTWDSLHLEIQAMLAGYVDDMLDSLQKSIVDAHLAGCEACRADIVRQASIIQRLNKMTVTRMTAQQHQRIDHALDVAPQSRKPDPSNTLGFMQNLWQKFQQPSVGITGWGLALALLLMILNPNWSVSTQPDVPMVKDVLAEYRHITEMSLPVSNKSMDNIPPAIWPNARVLASWKTKIGGANAEAFAIRTGNKVVLQFRVDEAVFFHNPAVRQAIANQGSYRVNNSELEVLALPLKDAGLLMVAPSDALPALEKLKLKST